MRWTMVLLAPIMSRALNIGILLVLLLGTAALGVTIEAWRRATWRHVTFRGDRVLVSTADGRVEESDVVFDAVAQAEYNASRPLREHFDKLETTGTFRTNVTVDVIRQGIYRNIEIYAAASTSPVGVGAIGFSPIGHGVLDANELAYKPSDRLVIYGGVSSAYRLFLATSDSTGNISLGWVAPTSASPNFPYAYFSSTNGYNRGRAFRVGFYTTGWHTTPQSV